MRPSRYNYLCEVEGRYYVYQLVGGGLLEVDHELYSALQAHEVGNVPMEMHAVLRDANFIVEDDVDEVALIRSANLRARYRSHAMRVTILPTLACNFACWYCYEKHVASKMSDTSVAAIVQFVQQHLVQTGKKELILDWFGGEPLLCFGNVIHPMQQLKAWCAEQNVTFRSMMTTNGSLITPRMASQMEEIELRQFQITLDGGRQHHNRTRFSAKIADSYELILSNIRMLCDILVSPSIELRINYTNENAESLVSILDDLDDILRPFVRLSPHIVWQERRDNEAMQIALRNFESKAQARGFQVVQAIPSVRCTSCYTENADQFVINYNLDVYKCTARDFDGTHSIGKIDGKGNFTPNGAFYKYFSRPSPFTEHPECLECSFLPCCLCGSLCPQKQLENASFSCNKSEVEATINRYIKHKLSL